MKICPNCGKEMDDAALFCINCGTKYESAEEKYAPTAEETPIMNETPVDVFAKPQTDNSMYAAPQENQADFMEQPQMNQADFMAQPQENQTDFMAQPQESQADFMANLQTEGMNGFPGQMNPNEKKKSKKPLIIGGIIGAVALVALIITFVVIFVTGNEEMALKNYVTVTVEGREGKATAYAEFNREKFVKDLAKLYDIDLEKTKTSNKDYKSVLKIVGYLSTELDYVIENDTELENGDEVEVKFEIDKKTIEKIEEEGLDLDVSSYKYKVEGLDEVKKVDPLKDVQIEVEGIYPNLEVTAKYVGDDKYVKENFYYRVEVTKDRKVNVECCTYSNLERDGYELVKNEKEFELEKYATYEVEIDDFKQKDIQIYIDDAEELVGKWVKNNRYYLDNATGFEGFEYLGCILEVAEKPNMFSTPSVYVIFEVELVGLEDEEAEAKRVFAYEVRDIYLDEEGKLQAQDYDAELYRMQMVEDMKSFVSYMENGNNTVAIDGDAVEKLLDDTTDEEETTDEKETTTDTSIEGMTLEEMVATDEFQKEIQSAKEEVDNDTLTMEVFAEGNKLVYLYTYSMEVEDKATRDAMKASIEEALASQESTFKELAQKLNTQLSRDDIEVVLRYVDSKGNLISETSHAQ